MAVRKVGKRWAVAVYDPHIKNTRTLPGRYDTRREAKEAEAEALKSRRRGTGEEPVDSYERSWINENPRNRESTNQHYREIGRLVAKDFKGRPLAAVTVRDAKRYALEHPGRARVARAMWSDAVRDGAVGSNPFLNLRVLASGRRGVDDVPTTAQVELFASKAGEVWEDYGRRVYANLIRVAAWTGLRPGELYGLEWGDVDLSRGRVVVERQFTARTRKLGAPKYDSVREVPLCQPARQALLDIPRSAAYVATAPRGGRFQGTVQHHYWHPVRCAAGLSHMDFYSLRHHFGTWLANRGVSPYDIAQVMGHRDGGQTALERYIRVRPEDSLGRVAGVMEGAVVVPLRRAQESGS